MFKYEKNTAQHSKRGREGERERKKNSITSMMYKCYYESTVDTVDTVSIEWIQNST